LTIYVAPLQGIYSGLVYMVLNVEMNE